MPFQLNATTGCLDLVRGASWVNSVESDPLSWSKASDQTLLTGDKSGSFDLTTTGNLAIRSDTGYIDLGATANDYKIQWDGSDAVHTITAGDFVFNGGDVEIEKNVGIGIAPTTTLDVQGAGAKMSNPNGSFDLGVYSKTSGGYSSQFRFYRGTTLVGGIGGYGNAIPRITMTNSYAEDMIACAVNSRGVGIGGIGGILAGTETLTVKQINGATKITSVKLVEADNQGTNEIFGIYGSYSSGWVNPRFVVLGGGDVKIPADSKKLYFGAGDDGYAQHTGTGLEIRSDNTTATDYLQLRGGTNGIDFNIGATEQITLTDGKLAPTTDDDISLGDSTHAFKEIYSNKYFSADNSEGYTGSFTDNDGNTITVKNGLITAKTAP